MFPMASVWLLLLSAWNLNGILALTFNVGAPTECGPLVVNWSGGQPPYQLLLLRIFSGSRNISIPDSSQNTFSTPLTLAKGDQFMLTMSDATGFASGGFTPVLTVGAGKAGSCNTTEPTVPWTYSLPSAFRQCGQFLFTEYDSAVQPITITGVVPGGEFFTLSPPKGPTTFSWLANVAGGTDMVFFAMDSQGRAGGVSPLQSAQPSVDQTCLNADAPTTTSLAPSVSVSKAPPKQTTTTTTTKSSAPQASESKASGPPTTTNTTAAVIGTTFGVIILLAAVVTLVLFCMKNQCAGWLQRHSPPRRVSKHSRLGSQMDLTLPPRQHNRVPSNNTLSNLPYTYTQSNTHSRSDFAARSEYELSQGPEPTPFMLTSPSALDTPSLYPSTEYNSDRMSNLTAGQRKAAMAGHSVYAPSRIILHTDAEEIQPDENGVIELPPTYSNRPRRDVPPPSEIGERQSPAHQASPERDTLPSLPSVATHAPLENPFDPHDGYATR